MLWCIYGAPAVLLNSNFLWRWENYEGKNRVLLLNAIFKGYLKASFLSDGGSNFCRRGFVYFWYIGSGLEHQLEQFHDHTLICRRVKIQESLTGVAPVPFLERAALPFCVST